jgi:hypothetical protein
MSGSSRARKSPRAVEGKLYVFDVSGSWSEARRYLVMESITCLSVAHLSSLFSVPSPEVNLEEEV